MPPRPSDRALRKLVADLADRPKADILAVLGDLGSAERGRVERLMAEFRGEPVGSTARAARPVAVANVEGLSPWLAERLRTAADGVLTTDFVMTARAVDALKVAAASVSIDRRPTIAALGEQRLGPALFDVVARWLSGPVR